MPENKERKEEKESWGTVEKYLASEIISRREEVSKAKGFAIACLTVAVVTVGIGGMVINYKNDQEWRELFSSYDFVSQDGQGYNYYNSDIGGDVLNGTENKEAEEPGKGSGDSY